MSPLAGTAALLLLVLVALVAMLSRLARPPRRHAVLAWTFFGALGAEAALLVALVAGLSLLRSAALVAVAGTWMLLPAGVATAAAVLLAGKGATGSWRALAILGALVAILAGLLGALLGAWFGMDA